MASRLADAERRYHASLGVPAQSRRWRVTVRNEFWVACCDTTSLTRFEDSASAQDAAIDHMRSCPEARNGRRAAARRTTQTQQQEEGSDV